MLSLVYEGVTRYAMPRKYTRTPGARRYADYDPKNVEKAVNDIKAGLLSIRGAAEKYEVDKMKLYRCLRGKHQKKYGGQTILTSVEETDLTKKLLIAGEWGFPMTTWDVRSIIKNYLDRQGRTIRTFKNNMPGQDWVKSFLARNGQALTVRLAENIKRCRAEVSPQIINNYFDHLEISINGIQSQSIINYDETNLSDDPGRKRVVVKRGCKHPEFILNSSKASTSIMMACAADGTLLPPFIIYRSMHLWDTWTSGGPKGARYANTKSGWIDQKTFEEWFLTIALPYLKKNDPPRALIGDNLSSHISAQVISLCEENDVRFIFLPKNSTHLCQPLDVSFFRPFKRHWRDILMNWKMKGHRGVVPKDQFPALLNKLLKQIEPTAKDIIKSGFKKCGIIPTDRTKILEQIPPSSEDDRAQVSSEMETSLINILRELRYGSAEVNPGTARKKKNLRVEPGQSVVNQDADVISSEQEQVSLHDESVFDNTNPEGDEDNTETNNAEESQAASPPTLENINYYDINEGDFLIIELQVANANTKSQQTHTYVGHAYSVTSTSSGRNTCVEVKFMRPYKDTKDTFMWPTVDDISFVYPHEVKFRLPAPTHLRRGMLRFPFDVILH